MKTIKILLVIILCLEGTAKTYSQSTNFPTCSFPFSGVQKSWVSATSLALPLDKTHDKKYYWRGLVDRQNTAGNIAFQVRITNKVNYPTTVRVIKVTRNLLGQESYSVYQSCADINSTGSSKYYDFTVPANCYAYDFEVIYPNTTSAGQTARINGVIDITVCRSIGSGCY